MEPGSTLLLKTGFEGRGGDEAINRGFPHHIIYERNMYTWEGSEGEKYLKRIKIKHPHNLSEITTFNSVVYMKEGFVFRLLL